MDPRVTDDEFAVLDWLHHHWEQAAPEVQDFLSTALRDQLGLDEGRYAKARDFLKHFELVETRAAEVESGDKVEAIKLTPDGENLYRHAVHDPGRFRFEPPQPPAELVRIDD